jgi:hypothetical protein
MRSDLKRVLGVLAGALLGVLVVSIARGRFALGLLLGAVAACVIYLPALWVYRRWQDPERGRREAN